MRISRLVGLSIAIVIAAFALPSVAGNDKKQYSLQMSIVSAPPAQMTPPFTVKATLANEGNSTINSFRLFVNGMVVVGVDQPATGHATFDGMSVSVTGMHPLKSGDALDVTIRVNSCGDGSWRAAVWTGSSLNGQNFTLVPGDPMNLMTPISCGNVASGPFVVPNSITNCGVGGERDSYDKDGSAPQGVPYFVTNTVPVNGQLHFRWPTTFGNVGFDVGHDPAAAFQYSVCASGPLVTDAPISVAWLNTDGTPTSTLGTPAFVAALDCIEPNILPAPYGTLTADLHLMDDRLSINTDAPSGTIPHPLPTDPTHPSATFDVVIGTERITVQLVCLDNDHDPTDPADCNEHEVGEGTVWKIVQRGVGGTALPPSGAWTANDHHLVMSTPLPILLANTGPYVAGHQAQMCISAQASQDTTPPTHTNTFIDIGDGWVSFD